MKAVLFDLDYTLLDRNATVRSFLSQQYRECISGNYSIAEQDYVAAYCERDPLGFDDRSEVYEFMAEHLQAELPASKLAEDFNRKAWGHCRFFEASQRVLDHVRGMGMAIAIVTNGTARSQNAKLEACGLKKLVDGWVISEEVGVRKPDPLIFKTICTELGVAPDQCIFVGDDPQGDIAGGHALGMKTVWCKTFKDWPPDLQQVFDYSIGDIGELPELPPFCTLG